MWRRFHKINYRGAPVKLGAWPAPQALTPGYFEVLKAFVDSWDDFLGGWELFCGFSTLTYQTDLLYHQVLLLFTFSYLGFIWPIRGYYNWGWALLKLANLQIRCRVRIARRVHIRCRVRIILVGLGRWVVNTYTLRRALRALCNLHYLFQKIFVWFYHFRKLRIICVVCRSHYILIWFAWGLILWHLASRGWNRWGINHHRTLPLRFREHGRVLRALIFITQFVSQQLENVPILQWQLLILMLNRLILPLNSFQLFSLPLNLFQYLK